jgi:hypothetical protein
METFTKLFGSLLVFVYHCFDRIVINGYLSGLSRPGQVVHFVREVLGIPVVSKEVLSQRTNDYQNWVEAYARNHRIPIEWAGKGVRKEEYVLPALHGMEKANAFGVYFIFKSMEQGRTFRITVPKYPTEDPNHRILAPQTSRFTHYPKNGSQPAALAKRGALPRTFPRRKARKAALRMILQRPP